SAPTHTDRDSGSRHETSGFHRSSTSGFRRFSRGGGGFSPALIEPERRVRIGHQGRVRPHTVGPAVQAENEIVEALRVAGGEQQGDGGEQDEERDQPDSAGPDPPEPAVTVLAPAVPAPTVPA